KGAEKAACKVPVRAQELRVIGKVEELRPDHKRCPFRNASQLVEPKIPVVESRTMEESPAGVAHPTQRFRTESRLIEVSIGSAVRPGVSRILENQIADKIRLIHTPCAGERTVAALSDGHG